MPEQATKRGDAVTGARFTGAFETQFVRRGIRGLNLKDAIDVVPPEQSTRITNIAHEGTGDEASRPGQTSFASGGTLHHSVRKLYQPASGLTTRIWGVDTSLFLAASGALGAAIDAGYSGDPLALVPHRPPLSGEPWMFVADRSRMRKVRGDGLDLPLGLPAPAAAAVPTLAGHLTTSICTFDGTDGSVAASWTPTAGVDTNGAAANVPTAADIPGPSGNAVEFQTQPGSTVSAAYDSWWGFAAARNLNTLQGGALAASDDDLMHFYLQIDRPERLVELRIYLVVSAAFDPTILPGTDSTGVSNTQAYVKTIRGNDFAAFISANQTLQNAIADGLIGQTSEFVYNEITNQSADAFQQTDREVYNAQRDQSRQIPVQAGQSAREWVRYGYFETPLRRGDFTRLGSDTTRNWGDVTGLVIYVKVSSAAPIQFALDDFFLHGGYGIDSTEPGAQPYDWRYTHYDPRTGAEGNGSPEMAEADFLDVDRKHVNVTPAAYGDAAIRQRFYRRGGSVIDDWYYTGMNAADGGVYLDEESDDATVAAGSLPIDHFQPFPTIDANGNTVLAQPLPALWGPIDGMLLACGDPYRPGHLYWTLPGSPDHASASSNVEVCPPSEELMNGGMVGNQAFVFSRERLYMLYPSLSGTATVDYAPTRCKRGIKSRWAFCVGPGGIYFAVENEGVFVTNGGDEEWISRDLDPLFQGETRNGYLPIDWTAKTAIRMTCWENKLYLLYQDTGGARQVAVYHVLQKHWLSYTFGRPLALLQGEDEPTLLLGSLNLGKTYTHEGFSDDGLAIACVDRTGAFSANNREEKLIGDQVVDADTQSTVIAAVNYLNEEAVANASTSLPTGTSRERYVLDVFGDTPQRAHSISTQLSWSSAVAAPHVFQIGYGTTPQPEITKQRVTNWDDLGSADEVWISGVTLDVDTNGETRSIVIERDFNSTRSVVTTLSVTSSGRHKLRFSWPAVSANQVRVRPTDDTCKFWLLYRCDWDFQVEPPRISKWDVHFENGWDQYHTGLDLYCDTEGFTKQVEVWVDQVRLLNPATGLTYWPVVANGRKVVHLTLPWGRGHVYRFLAIDNNPGLLYTHRWHLEAEPSEQANWNQNFSILGSRTDKWLKAVIFECDTFNQVKSVTIEADGVVVETLAIQANGRKVVQKALTVQQLGRVWRMYPTDAFPGRLYTAQPIFDEEPFQLDRWETQETNHGIPGWFVPLYGHLVLKSTLPVTLTIIVQHNQPRSGSAAHRTTVGYTIPATGGVKASHFQSFRAGKGVLVRYILTSDAPFWLYRAETTVVVQPWGAQQPIVVKPFGDDDADPGRGMINTTLSAERSGGGLAALLGSLGEKGSAG